MNAISNIFVALSLIFGGGYALDKIYMFVKGAAVEQIQQGMPPLSSFTSQLTCSKITKDGRFVKLPCHRSRKR